MCGAGRIDSPDGQVERRLPEAGAEQPAVGLREERLGDLVRAARHVVELRGRTGRCQVSMRLLHVAHRGGEEPRAEAEHGQPDGHEGEPVGGHVEQREEAAEEHQRRAEVADEDEHHHRAAPHHEQRPEVLQRRDGDAQEAARALHEHLARVAQVRGEEDDDGDLPELRRLEGDRPQLHAEVRAVDLLADAGHARHEQQQQAGGGHRVAVALEHAEVAQEDDRGGEQQQPDHEPLRLLAREVLVEPVDHDEPEAGEHGDEREEVRDPRRAA